MDLHAISLRVAGATLDVIRDIGVFDRSVEPQLKASLQKLVDDGMELDEATHILIQTAVDSAKKIWPSANFPNVHPQVASFQEAIWEIENVIHELLHEAVDKDFGLGKTHPVQDLINEFYIGTIGAKPPNTGLDSLLNRGPLPNPTVGEWLSQMESTVGDVPADVQPVVKKALKLLRRGLADDLKSKPWERMYGDEYERIRSKVANIMESFEDPGLDAVTVETDKEMKLFISLLVSRLKKV